MLSDKFQHRNWYGLDQKIPILGFGAWQLAGPLEKQSKAHGFPPLEGCSAEQLVHQFLSEGFRFFDTAQAYGNGLSESLLGKALRTSSVGTEAIICTKVSLDGEDGVSRKSLFEKLDESLSRLKKDVIDVLLIHSPPVTINWKSFDFDPFLRAQESGKIRTFGISARTLSCAQKFLDAGEGTCIEWSMNLTERRPAEELLPKIEKLGCNFIARSPLARGFLTSRRAHEERPSFSSDDFRSSLDPDWVAWVHAQSKLLGSRVSDLGLSLEMASLLYLMRAPGVSAVIPGLRSLKQLEVLKEASKEFADDRMDFDVLTQGVPQTYPAWSD